MLPDCSTPPPLKSRGNTVAWSFCTSEMKVGAYAQEISAGGGLAAREVFRTAGVDHRRHRQIKQLRDLPPTPALGAQPYRLVAPEGPGRLKAFPWNVGNFRHFKPEC